MALSGLFSSSKKKTVTCKPGRGWTYEIAGESHYQSNLLRLAGGSKEEFGCDLEVDAILKPEPSNAFDKNAVAVYINKNQVGYLSETDAPIFNFFLQNNNASVGTCSAKVVWGWDKGDGDEGHFGVKLKISWPPKASS